MHRPQPQSGFSLFELLIALVIFSIGLLAVGGLQSVSKKANFESMQRTSATQIVNGMLEDMRTNGSAISQYVVAADIGGGARGGQPVPNCSIGAECNATQKAAFDLWFWEQLLDGNLETSGGAGTGGLVLPTLCIDGPAGGVAGIYRVTIVWRGTASLTNLAVNTCGIGSGNYGDQGELRRIVQIPTYIDPNF